MECNHLKQLKDFFKQRGIKQDELTNEFNVSQSYISQLINGKKEAGKKVASKLSEKYGISEAWVLTGKGEMLAQPQETTIVPSDNSYGDKASWNNNITITHTQETNIEDNSHSVILRPIVNKLLASRPNTDVYKIVKEDGVKLQHILAFPQYDDFDFYYQVRQDAMFPTYDKGDILALMHMPVDAHIIQGSAMVIDTKSFGFLFRRVYDNGDSYECKCINENSVFRNQSIPKDDVIRLYRVIYSIKSGD